jgi:serine/threonine protein kinase
MFTSTQPNKLINTMTYLKIHQQHPEMFIYFELTGAIQDGATGSFSHLTRRWSNPDNHEAPPEDLTFPVTIEIRFDLSNTYEYGFKILPGRKSHARSNEQISLYAEVEAQMFNHSLGEIKVQHTQTDQLEYLLMPYCPGPTLKNYTLNFKLRADQARGLLLSIAKKIISVNSRNVVLMDFGDTNCSVEMPIEKNVITNNCLAMKRLQFIAGEISAHILDFGVSHQIDEDILTPCKTVNNYYPPEVQSQHLSFAIIDTLPPAKAGIDAYCFGSCLGHFLLPRFTRLNPSDKRFLKTTAQALRHPLTEHRKTLADFCEELQVPVSPPRNLSMTLNRQQLALMLNCNLWFAEKLMRMTYLSEQFQHLCAANLFKACLLKQFFDPNFSSRLPITTLCIRYGLLDLFPLKLILSSTQKTLEKLEMEICMKLEHEEAEDNNTALVFPQDQRSNVMSFFKKAEPTVFQQFNTEELRVQPLTSYS